MPTLGTGVGDVDLDTAARIMMETMQMFRVDNQPQFVVVYVLSATALAAFQKYV